LIGTLYNLYLQITISDFMIDDIVSFLENQIKLEKKIIESAKNSLNSINNEAVKAALKGVSLDSEKHAEMYRSAINILNASSAPLNEEQLELNKKLVSNHIKMEEAVIQQLEKRINDVENEKVKLLLKTILQDEYRHHKLLKKPPRDTCARRGHHQ